MISLYVFVVLLATAAIAENDDAIKCEDHPTTAKVCPQWKAGGACEKNRETMRTYCRKTCNDCKTPSPPFPSIPPCASSQYGCCWDNKTIAQGPTSDISQSQCTPCLDKQSSKFCNGWRSDCTSSIAGQGDVMRELCPQVCGVPCDYNLNKNRCRDDLANANNCLQWYADGKCTTEQDKMRVLCPSLCGFCTAKSG